MGKVRELPVEHLTALVDDLPLFEMANLEPYQTGIEGTIYISTKQGSHAPRVKYYAGRPGDNQPSMSVLIAPNPEVVESHLPVRTANRVAPMVREWVRLNHEKLRNFWFNGNTWYQREVDAFIDGLEKCPEPAARSATPSRPRRR
jgi:hypothetical protein